MISFMDCAFGVELVYHPHPQDYPDFSSKSRGFIVLHLTFRSMIHLELKFVKGIRSVSRFTIFCYVDVQLFQHQLLKKTIFSLLYYFCFLVKDNYIYVGLFPFYG